MLEIDGQSRMDEICRYSIDCHPFFFFELIRIQTLQVGSSIPSTMQMDEFSIDSNPIQYKRN